MQPISIEISSYLTDTEQKISWHVFYWDRRCRLLYRLYEKSNVYCASMETTMIISHECRLSVHCAVLMSCCPFMQKLNCWCISVTLGVHFAFFSLNACLTDCPGVLTVDTGQMDKTKLLIFEVWLADPTAYYGWLSMYNSDFETWMLQGWPVHWLLIDHTVWWPDPYKHCCYSWLSFLDS